MLLGVSLSAYGEGTKIVLNTIKNTGNVHKEIRRTPSHFPEVYVNGSILIFDTNCDGCPIMLIDSNGEIVYTAVIDESGTIELPTNLIGTYELQLVRGCITFAGEIELNIL